MNPPNARLRVPTLLRAAASTLAAAIAVSMIFAAPASASTTTVGETTVESALSAVGTDNDALRYDNRLTRSSDVAPHQTAAAISTIGNTAQESTKPLPTVSIINSGSLSYGGLIHGYITYNGKRLVGHSTVLAQMWIGDDYFFEVFDAYDGEYLAPYILDPLDVGDVVRVVITSLETAQYGASSTSPRNYNVVDLPLPMIVTPPTSRYYAPIADLAVGVVLPSNVYIPDGAIEVIATAHFHDGDQTVTSPVEGGEAIFSYTTGHSILPMTFVIEETFFNKAASLPTRNFRISLGVTLAISPPRGATLARRGVVQLQLAGPGITQAQGQPVYMYVSVGGRNFVFQGSINRSTATISYSLPESMIDQTAQVRYQTHNGPILLASSTTLRTQKVVK